MGADTWGFARARSEGPFAALGLTVNRTTRARRGATFACRHGMACYSTSMADDLLHAALGRIEHAITRLEAIEPGARAPTPGLAEAYAQLDERHGLLRLRIQETIERLDALVAVKAPRG